MNKLLSINKNINIKNSRGGGGGIPGPPLLYDTILSQFSCQRLRIRNLTIIDHVT